jgi:hypothetical protein
MPGEAPGIHALVTSVRLAKAWMAGASPAMTGLGRANWKML